MVDIVNAASRSRMMAAIRSRNTKPELLVRRRLHARGFRYTLDGAGLPGRPDIVLPKWKVAIFVNGCFWHWHGCHLSKIPSANRSFWETKLTANQTRDDVSQMAIVSAGWRVAIVWECALRGSFAESQLPHLIRNLERWIRAEPKSKVELTLFHGHLIVVNQGVQDAPSQSALSSAISPADDRFSSHWAQAQRASA